MVERHEYSGKIRVRMMPLARAAVGVDYDNNDEIIIILAIVWTADRSASSFLFLLTLMAGSSSHCCALITTKSFCVTVLCLVMLESNKT